jgi:hypothetical protein
MTPQLARIQMEYYRCHGHQLADCMIQQGILVTHSTNTIAGIQKDTLHWLSEMSNQLNQRHPVMKRTVNTGMAMHEAATYLHHVSRSILSRGPSHSKDKRVNDYFCIRLSSAVYGWPSLPVGAMPIFDDVFRNNDNMDIVIEPRWNPLYLPTAPRRFGQIDVQRNAREQRNIQEYNRRRQNLQQREQQQQPNPRQQQNPRQPNRQQPIPRQPNRQQPIPQQPNRQQPIPQQPIPQQPIPQQPIPQQPIPQQPIPQQQQQNHEAQNHNQQNQQMQTMTYRRAPRNPVDGIVYDVGDNNQNYQIWIPTEDLDLDYELPPAGIERTLIAAENVINLFISLIYACFPDRFVNKANSAGIDKSKLLYNTVTKFITPDLIHIVNWVMPGRGLEDRLVKLSKKNK